VKISASQKGPPGRYRIAALARAAKTTVRNVRAYRERGLLPPPILQGRTGYYNEAHRDRLKAIVAMLDRGYSLNSIAELLGAHDRGEPLAGVVGLELAVTAPLAGDFDEPAEIDALGPLFGSLDPATLRLAIRSGFLSSSGGRLQVASSALLRTGHALLHAGIPPRALLRELARVQRDLDRVAARFVGLIVRHLFAPHGKGLPPLHAIPKLTEHVIRARPLAGDVVQTVFRRALERHMQAELAKRKAQSAVRRRRAGESRSTK
jgi:DNA-binding transcriptional MerR regulator